MDSVGGVMGAAGRQSASAGALPAPGAFSTVEDSRSSGGAQRQLPGACQAQAVFECMHVCVCTFQCACFCIRMVGLKLARLPISSSCTA